MSPFDLWVYLSAAPLFWLTATLVVWLLALRLVTLFRGHPAVNPVLISIVLLGGLLHLTGTPYRVYFDGAQFVHFLLGPATVALAVPLWRHRAVVKREIAPMAGALLVGATVAIVSAIVVARSFGATREVVASLAPKSVTAAVAMAVSERVGGLPALTAALVITTGIIGAVLVTPTMNLLGVRDWTARGFAAGLASHGLGTARAFACHPLAGVFAGIAMGLNAIVTAMLTPLIVAWLL
ncbi:MAG: LrgB family protein [Hyphomicrobiales bacterium]|nr:LrgB family protein [Hyphomicrobiales bacterium]